MPESLCNELYPCIVCLTDGLILLLYFFCISSPVLKVFAKSNCSKNLSFGLFFRLLVIVISSNALLRCTGAIFKRYSDSAGQGHRLLLTVNRAIFYIKYKQSPRQRAASTIALCLLLPSEIIAGAGKCNQRQRAS